MGNNNEPIEIPITIGFPSGWPFPEFQEWMFMLMQDFAKGLTAHDRTMQNQIYKYIYDNLNKIQDNLKTSIDAATLQSYKANQSINKILEMLGGTSNNTLKDITDALLWLTNVTLGQSNTMHTSFNNMQNSITDSTNNLSSKMETLNVSINNTMLDGLSDVSNTITKSIEESDKSIENNISLLDLSIQSKVADSENTIKYSLGNVQNNLTNVMSLNTEKVNEELQSLSTMIDSQKGSFKEGFEWFWEQLRGWLESNVTISQQDLLSQLQNQISTQVSVSKQLHS